MIHSLMEKMGVAKELYQGGDLVVTTPIDGGEIGRLTTASSSLSDFPLHREILTTVIAELRRSP